MRTPRAPLLLVVALAGGCADLVVEPRDAPRPVEGFTVVNPSPRTGTTLVARWDEPVTVVGTEACLFFEDADGFQDGAPIVCTPIGDAPTTREHRVEGLVPDVDYAFQIVMRSESGAESTPARATGRPVKDAPPLVTFTAEAAAQGGVTLAWTLADDLGIAESVVVARAPGATAPAAPDDDGASLVVESGLESTGFFDAAAPSATTVSYAAWVKDREGNLTTPLTATVTTRIGAVTGLTASLLTENGAMTGAVALAWTDVDSPDVTGYVVVRTAAGITITTPTDDAATTVCAAVPQGAGGCTEEGAPLGDVRYHVFTSESGGGLAGPAVVELAIPDLRLDVFTAVPSGGGVTLTWVLAGDATGVVILRSDVGFVSGPDDAGGTVVANTLASPTVDPGLAPGAVVYYSAFPRGADASLAGPGRFASTAPLTGPVEDLVAVALTVDDELTGEVALTWSQPSGGSFSTARVVRKSASDPTSPDDGVVVCEAALIDCTDTTAPHASVAHYAVWARDALGTFTDTGAFATVPIADEHPPGVVTGLSAARNEIPGDDDRITLTYALPTDDVLDRVEVWTKGGAPPQTPGEVGATKVVTRDPPETSAAFDLTPGATTHASVFVFDDAGNASLPASVFVPVTTGIVLQTWGTLWVPERVVEHWAADPRALAWDAAASGASSCALAADVDDDGPGPGDVVTPVALVGASVVMPVRTTRYTLTCDTDDGPLSAFVVLEVVDAAFGWTLTVAPAISRDVGALPGGGAVGLVSNQRVLVDEQGGVVGIDDLAPLQGFGPPASATAIAQHLDVFADGRTAVAAQVSTANQAVPIGVIDDVGATSHEAHLDINLVAGTDPEIADLGVVDSAPHAGRVVFAGTINVDTDLVDGPPSAPGGSIVLDAVYGGRDMFVAALDDDGPAWGAVGGSLGADRLDAMAALDDGGAVIAGTLGADPGAFGAIIVDDTSPFQNAPWGVVATVDGDGAWTWAEGLPLMDATDAVAVHPDGGFVVAGRWNSPTQLQLSRRGPSLLPTDKWTRTASFCCGVYVPAGEIYARYTGLAFDDEGTLWAVGTAYGILDFNGFESDDEDWSLRFGIDQKARAFVARYTGDGHLMFARTIVVPEGKTTRLAKSKGATDALYAFTVLRNPTVLEDSWAQAFGPGALNEMPTDLTAGQTGGALMKLGPVPAPLSPPTGLGASLVGSDVTVSFTRPAGGLTDRYLVVRGTGAPPGGPLGADVVVVADGDGITGGTDTGVPPSSALYYVAYRVSDYPLYAASEVVRVDVP